MLAKESMEEMNELTHMNKAEEQENNQIKVELVNVNTQTVYKIRILVRSKQVQMPSVVDVTQVLLLMNGLRVTGIEIMEVMKSNGHI